MKFPVKVFFLIPVLALVASCHTINTMQTTVIKNFAGTAKEVSDMPYKILYNYYSIEFKRKQLIPEFYVTGDTSKEYISNLSESVISQIEDMRNEYHADLKKAEEVKRIYELLEAYINSLEKLSANTYARDFEKKSADMGNKMNDLVNKINNYPKSTIRLSLNPGEWLTSLTIMYGRTRLKTRQATLLKDYINRADTLVQAINRNYQDIQVPIMNSWYEDEKNAIRQQFKRSIFAYLENLNRHPKSGTSIVALEFYSQINPVYYELTEEIYRNQLLIEKSVSLMNNLAQTHSNLKHMFEAKNNWLSVVEEVDGLKEKLFILKDVLNKESQEKFSFYKNFLMQNEKPLKDIFDKH